jgi:cytochrome c oxidase subunit 2
MKKKLGNPEFEYEISCDQMCGRGHYTMRGIVKVLTHDEFILWKAKQKPNYAQVMAEKAPAAATAPAAAEPAAAPAKTDSIAAKSTASR